MIAINPLTDPVADCTRNVINMQTETVLVRPKRNAIREIRDLRRKQTAETALDGLSHDNEIFGFTKGQFSVIDIITAVLAKTGPATLDISTWTAANAEISAVLDFVNTKAVISSRWLVDASFQRRFPHLAQRIRDVFGTEAVRVAKNHAKFALITNANWKIVLRTSMNLNFNPRFEDFTIAHDPELHAFISQIMDSIWKRQTSSMANERPYEIFKHFRDAL